MTTRNINSTTRLTMGTPPLPAWWEDTGVDLAPHGRPDTTLERCPLIHHRETGIYALWTGGASIASVDQRRAAQAMTDAVFVEAFPGWHPVGRDD